MACLCHRPPPMTSPAAISATHSDDRLRHRSVALRYNYTILTYLALLILVVLITAIARDMLWLERWKIAVCVRQTPNALFLLTII